MNETMLQTAERVWPGNWAVVNMRKQMGRPDGNDELFRWVSEDELVRILLCISGHSGAYHTTFTVNAYACGFAQHRDLETAIAAARDRVHALGRALLMTESESP